jgi:Acetyltransferase (GNAT) domain
MTLPDLAGRPVDDRPEARASGRGTGYSHPDYAASLTEFGQPGLLPACGGSILERPIPGNEARDAMGCYPIFSCRDWTLLESDLERIKHGLISLVLVTDPFGDYSEEQLARAFPDLFRRFKEHFVADLQQPAKSFVTSHHQYYARRALEKVTVECCHDPAEAVDEWSALYAALVARHQLTGIKAFSRAAFAKQLSVPGMVMLRARHEGETVGAHLFYEDGDVTYSHLAASSERGYELMAAYALSWAALEYFAGKVRWIDWGAGAGLSGSEKDGLTRFKRAWSNETRPAWLCGRIFDEARYRELARVNGSAESNYFPAYRADEFR